MFRHLDLTKQTNSDLCMMKIALLDEQDRTSKALRAIPGIGGGPMGLTPDSVKNSPEYKAARAAWTKAWNELRAFNQFINRKRKGR
jgi:hypothetical protein